MWGKLCGIETLTYLSWVKLNLTQHTPRYIFPVGFKSQRVFTSFVNPDAKTLYTCEIVERGEAPLVCDFARVMLTEFSSLAWWLRML